VTTKPNQTAVDGLAALPSPTLFLIFFAAIALSHLTLLHLPYFWDEGGYYIPAALDFYHRFTLIPEFTNAHPPLPNVFLGTLWHITGFSILATRLAVSAVAAAALVAIFRLTQRLLTPTAAIAVTLLTAVYPIWYAQSTLAHADIFAAAFTLAAFALYLPATTLEICHPEQREGSAFLQDPQHYIAIAILFSLAALSKETAIVEPAILAAIHLTRIVTTPITRRQNFKWLTTLSFPLLPLLAWYGYHHHKTGFTFGNPEYLRYNATANFTLAHISQGIYYRALHLLWQRNIWLAILLALACFALPRRANINRLTTTTIRTIAILIAGNWLAFSILGGALLTRYLLPIYPLILLLCVDQWRTRTNKWPMLAAITALAFFSAIWLNPPTAFAPEDNLTYRDMIVVHQEATAYIAEHYPDATVLTAWPAAAELFRPELGYVQQRVHVDPIENFTLTEIQKAAQSPEKYDTALVFTTHYTSPALEYYLLKHPNTHRGREFAQDRDLSPSEVAAMLHGQIVFKDNRNNEWAAVIRFKRSYEARNTPPTIIR
jgi:4-amino-4-deoxy-L-arabinose transferase-like glycosyltransferase